jgi:hypothetical protein
LDLFGYTLILKVAGGTGTVTWGAYADSLGFARILPDMTSATDLVVALGGSAQPAKGPGLLKLGQVNVTITSGVPVIQIGLGTSLDPSAITSFSTNCDGSDAPNTYVLGLDWFDVNGIGDRIRWIPDGVAVTSASGDQENFVSVPDGLGGTISVWEDRRAGERDIYTQRLDSSGHPLWTANGVGVCTATYDQLTPVAINDGSGGAIISWHDERNNNPFGDIYAQRISSSGIALWTANGVGLHCDFLPEISPNHKRWHRRGNSHLGGR